MLTRRDMLATASAMALMGTTARAQTAAPGETNWLHYANDLSSTRYSPLDQISAANFDHLEPVWKFSTNALGPRLDADYQSTPLVVNGRIYVTAGFRRDVVCLDAGTGELLWLHTYDEGTRIGTVRRPPRGVPKAEFASQNWYDVWYPNRGLLTPLSPDALEVHKA